MITLQNLGIFLFIIGMIVLISNFKLNIKKSIDIELLTITLLIVSFVMVNLQLVLTPKVFLPKEHKMIDSTTAIIGHYDKDSILVIEFDDRIQFEWEGLEEDIPEDKSYIQISGTNENTVYLNPIDE